MKIGGNVMAEIQCCNVKENSIGEAVKTWVEVQKIKGFLDLCSGDSEYEKFNTKLQQSSHVFICDFVPLKSNIIAENSRMKIGDNIYEIMLIDNPMGLDSQYEFYLKFVGGEESI